MRLVSALYGSWYPFDEMELFTDFDVVSSPDELKEGDVLVVWGGGDIPPEYYGKRRSEKSWAGKTPGNRDAAEWALILRAKEMGLPMIGVCRGGQMMCAAAGGYLIQHVTNHGGQHKVVTPEGRSFVTNSIHHQMMMPADAPHELLAWMPNPISKEYWDENTVLKAIDKEREYIYFNDIKAHAIQWHPEGMHLASEANQFVREQLKRTIYAA